MLDTCLGAGAEMTEVVKSIVKRGAKGLEEGDKVGEKSGDGTGGSGEAPMLSARERLRLHVNRNLAMQQQEAKMGGASSKGPASAGGPSAPQAGGAPSGTEAVMAAGERAVPAAAAPPDAAGTARSPAAMTCLLYTSPSPRDQRGSRMPSSA